MSLQPELAPQTTGLPNPLAARDTLVDREVANPFLRYLLHLGVPLSISLLLHVAILVFLAFKTFEVIARPTIEVGEYEASLTESQADRLRDAFQWSEANLLEPPEPLTAEQSLDSLASLRDLASVDFGSFDAKELGEAGGKEGGTGLGIGDGALTLLGTGAGAGEAGSGGFGTGLGGGGARIGRAGVWDLRIQADKIAYVVDFSGSIIVAVDDLKKELKRSVGLLKPSQSFNVIIFYSSGGGQDEQVKTESFKPKLEPATPDVRREFFTWLDRKAPRGRTEPLEAIKRALALNPDALFFFSDGYFDDFVVTEVERLNRKARVRIYCLVFDDQLLADTSGLAPRETEGSQRLRRIAEANGGKVKIVTAKDLARR